MKTEKERKEINYGIEQIQNILHMIRPQKTWTIKFIEVTPEIIDTFSVWDKERFSILGNDEIIAVWDDDGYLLYVLHEYGNSSMWTLAELFDLLGRKF